MDFLNVFLEQFKNCFRLDMRDRMPIVTIDKCKTLFSALSWTFNEIESKQYIKTFEGIMTKEELKAMEAAKVEREKCLDFLDTLVDSKEFCMNVIKQTKEERIRVMQHVCFTHALGAPKDWMASCKGNNKHVVVW